MDRLDRVALAIFKGFVIISLLTGSFGACLWSRPAGATTGVAAWAYARQNSK